MADSNVIKEFLVAIGYKHDEAALKKVVGGVTTASKAVFKLGAVVEATAIAVAVGVARFASNLEQLYFAAQRTGSSADQLQAFGLAARNFGSSIDAAQASVEGLAAFMRNTYGGDRIIEGWLGSVGISARGINGEILTGTKLMTQLGKAFAVMRASGQTPRANQIAGQLGIDDKTMLAISSPGWAEEEERQEKRTKGWQGTAKAAHAFMNQLEDLKMSFFQMMLGFEGPAMAALEKAMTKIGTFMAHHGKQMVTDLSDAFTWVIDGLGKVLDWLDKHAREVFVRVEALFLDFNYNWTLYIKPTFDWLLTQFLKLDEATDGWSTKLLAVYGTLKLIGAAGLVDGILSLGAGLAKGLAGLLGGAVDVAAAGGVWGAAGAVFGVAAAGAIGAAIGTAIYAVMPEWMQRGVGDTIGHTVDWFKDLLDPKKRAQWEADPSHYNATHYPWENKSPTGPGGATVNVTNNVTVTGNVSPRETARAVTDSAEAAARKAGADLTREYAAVLR